MDPDVYDLGDDVVVIGAGNSAMDVARTALRKGARHVAVFSHSHDASASPRELEYAIADGVEIYYGACTEEISDEESYTGRLSSMIRATGYPSESRCS